MFMVDRFSLQELAERELLSREEAKRLSTLVGPAAILTGCEASSMELAVEAAKLNANKSVVQAVLKDVYAALNAETDEFRLWEQVKGIYLLLEPFNVQNGLLTQTLKVKRLIVLSRYTKEIEGIYS